MAAVRVRFSGPLKAAAGVAEVIIELPEAQETVACALERIRVLYPLVADRMAQGTAGAIPAYRVFLNGRSVAREATDVTPVVAGDELLLLLPIGGG